MYIYQYILLAGFICLLFNKKTALPSALFLCGWLVYVLVIFDFGVSGYYAATATIELVIAYVLNKNFRVIAWLGYTLMVLNIYGLLVHFNELGRDIYIGLYALISITQFMFLLARAIPNGITRLPAEHFVVRAVNFDSRGAYGIMYKNTATKGSNQ